MKTAENKAQILDFLYELPAIVRREGWVSRYDTESDTFSLVSPRLSDGARKEYVDDEFAFYFNKRRGVEGIFVEYFKANFLSHHRKIRGLLDSVRGKKEDLVTISKREAIKYVPELQSVLKDSILQHLEFKTG